MAVTRRLFLKSSGLALVSFGSAPSFLKRTVFSADLPASGKDAPILVAVFQRGAADGVSMVVPFGDKNYYAVRPQIAIPQPKSGDAESALDLDGHFGLHPALAPFKPLYDAGGLAVVHAVGSPDNTRSHFDAQDYMESGTPGRKATADGWLNRYMQANRRPGATPFRAVALGSKLPRAMAGQAPAIAMTTVNEFAIRGGQANNQAASGFEQLYSQSSNDLLYGTGKDTFEAVKMLKQANPQRYQPANGVNYPRSGFGQSLQQIAQLIKADIGIEVAFTDVGGWDTHANQGASRGQLANRLQDFAQSIAAFNNDLGDRMSNVVLLTMTEFGRTIRQNGSGGTDHGHSSCLFVIGGRVKGGKVYGEWPGLGNDQLYEGRDLALTTDFRSVFAEVASGHLRAGNVSPIFPGFDTAKTNFRGFIR